MKKNNIIILFLFILCSQNSFGQNNNGIKINLFQLESFIVNSNAQKHFLNLGIGYERIIFNSFGVSAETSVRKNTRILKMQERDRCEKIDELNFKIGIFKEISFSQLFRVKIGLNYIRERTKYDISYCEEANLINDTRFGQNIFSGAELGIQPELRLFKNIFLHLNIALQGGELHHVKPTSSIEDYLTWRISPIESTGIKVRF